MPRRKIWEVDIDITGPISISESICFRQEKGFDHDQFYSNISLRNQNFGITSTVTAYADNLDIAKTAAFVFLGRMVDILILDNDMPLILQDHENRVVSTAKFTTRRKLEKIDFESAFKVARKLELEHPALLKAIGWYSKGKISNNTLDSFLSYWNVIEITAKSYHTHTSRTREGVINKVYQCFLDYFGAEENWGVPERWINNMHEKRSSIAHGGEEASAEAISKISLLIPELSIISKRILNSVLNAEYPEDIWHQVEEERWLDLF